MTIFPREGWFRNPSTRTAHCTPRASINKLKATLLQLYLHKYEVRKPRPMAAMTVKSWRKAKGGDIEEEEEEQTR